MKREIWTFWENYLFSRIYTWVSHFGFTHQFCREFHAKSVEVFTAFLKLLLYKIFSFSIFYLKQYYLNVHTFPSKIKINFLQHLYDSKVYDKNTVFEVKNTFLHDMEEENFYVPQKREKFVFYHYFINFTGKKLQNCLNLVFFFF